MTKSGMARAFILLLSAACASAALAPALLAQQTQSPARPPVPSAQKLSGEPSRLASTSQLSQTAAAPTETSHPVPMTPAQKEEMRGDIFMARKMFHEAIEVYADLLVEQPKNARLLNKTGIAYQQLGDWRNAERFYKKACKADKHFASPRNNLGTAEFGRRKYGGAIKEYKKAIKIDPKMATIYVNLGYAYFARKKYKNAILAFRQAILTDPTVFQSLAKTDVVEEGLGNVDPGAYYYLLAKTFATLGNAESCAHYLKMSRDEGYKKFTDARTDPAFKSVLKDPRVRQILTPANTAAKKT